jgi:NAD(P)-dependent dehydrogenase (short-subunit alcohol dehydrogenase family)
MPGIHSLEQGLAVAGAPDHTGAMQARRGGLPRRGEKDPGGGMSTLFDMSGKTVLVTGASSAGLGRHFARMLAGAGATVVMAARREEALKELVAEIEAAGGKAHAVRMDVLDLASVKAGVARTIELTGGLDGLVNNSGVNRRGLLLDQTEADWDAVLDTNLKGVWAVATEVARHMAERGKGGSIVNIASLMSSRQSPGITAYAVSKAAVVQLTKQTALEWARFGIRVNAIAPGYFETDLNRDFIASERGQQMLKYIPMRRFGQHEELSGAMLLLLSDAGAYMTGSVVSVDGGHQVSPVS